MKNILYKKNNVFEDNLKSLIFLKMISKIQLNSIL